MQQSACLITCYLSLFTAHYSEISAVWMRGFLLGMESAISASLAGRLVGWSQRNTRHKPQPRPTGSGAKSCCTDQSWGSTGVSAWSQLHQHIPSPTGKGRNHSVPKSSGCKDTRSLSRRMEKKQLHLSSANSPPSFGCETTSPNVMKNGEKTSSVFPRQTTEISTSTAFNTYLLLQTKYSHIQGMSKPWGVQESLLWELSAKH